MEERRVAKRAGGKGSKESKKTKRKEGEGKED